MTPNQHASTYTTIGVAGTWNAVEVIIEHGPDWRTVPPIILALAALLAGINTFLNDSARRRREAAAMLPPPPPPAPNGQLNRCR